MIHTLTQTGRFGFVHGFKAAFLCAVLFSAAVLNADAANFTVNQTGDAGDGTCDATCTLRDAITAANNLSGDDTIDFSITGTISLSGTYLEILQSSGLTINGPAGGITVSGNNTNTVFIALTYSRVSINRLTITGGNGTYGGGIHSLGTLEISNSVITGNEAMVTAAVFWSTAREI